MNPIEGRTIDRGLVSVVAGQMVKYQDEVFRITQVLDFQTVLGLNVESGRAKVLRIAELKPVPAERVKGLYVHYDLNDIGSEEWATAQKRFSIISPLLEESQPRGVVEKRAREAGVDPVTVYRWLKRYKEYGEITALIPFKRGWSKGRRRISDEVEKVITEVIDNFYLGDQRPTATATVEKVLLRCKALKLTPPDGTTVRARIRELSDKDVLRGRGYKELAANKHSARPGSFGADYPLQIVQIDHTPADMIVLDDVHRKPIGRPWLSLAICVHSRMVTGYYLSLDAPSAVSVAMCLVHSILPKENWLALHGVEGEWPVWGKPVTVHTDNGPDFRAHDLIRSCTNHGINRSFRPVKTPHWGAHIERLMGTFSTTFKKDKGTTFSNPKEREGYDSEKKAIFTFGEYEERLVRNILKYNATYHEGIYMAPIRKWTISLFGNNEHASLAPLPPRVVDPWSFQLDFLPAEERAIHPYGVEMDAFYFADALRPWIGAIDKKTGKKRKFIFRRDPRDINRIWFYDPSLKEYFEIPVSRATFPGTTVAEYVAAKKKTIKEGRSAEDYEFIQRMLEENHEQETAAAERTKQARKKAQKRTNNAKQVTPASPKVREVPVPTTSASVPTGLLSVDDVDAFGGVW